MNVKFQRARAPEQKADRRAHLLRQAAQLFADRGSIPTAAQLAESAQVAKGTVYLYFRSKQEIFLALLEQRFADFLDDVLTGLQKNNVNNEQHLSRLLLDTLRQHEALLPLAVMGPTELEENVADEALLRYKQMLAEKMSNCAEQIATRTRFDVLEAQQRLTQSYALIIGLYQMSHNSAHFCRVLKSHALETLIPEFWPQLEQSLPRLWGAESS